MLVKAATGPRFNTRYDVLLCNLVKSRSRETDSLNCRITLKFDRHIGSTAADVPVKCQGDRIIVNTNLETLRDLKIRRIIGYRNGVLGVFSMCIYCLSWVAHSFSQ